MRILILIGAVIAGAAAMSLSAYAQDFPWCAQAAHGARNCGFQTHAQCMATARGMGGLCTRNTQYRANRHRQ
jgi:Protein of unknown function (DUF3551)